MMRLKLIRKKISHIHYQNSSAALKTKELGKGAVWLQSLVGVVCIIIGMLFLTSAENPLIFMAIIGLGLYLVFSLVFKSTNEYFEINKEKQEFIYFRGSGWINKGRGRIRAKTFAFNKLTIDWESDFQFDSVTILIQAEDRDRHIFRLILPQTSHTELLEWLDEKPIEAQAAASIIKPAIDIEGPVVGLGEQEISLVEQRSAMGHATMLTEIKSWGRSSLLLGVIHIVASGFLNPAWGVTLLVVGGLSFLVQEASMFVLYAVALVWVGISNILSTGLGLWTLFGIYQIYLGIRLFGKYKRYRDHEQKHIASLEEVPAEIKVGRAAQYFPWVGSGLSVLGLIIFGGVWVFLFISMMVIYAETQTTNLSETLFTTLDLIAGVSLGLGIVGFALSLAAVLSKYTPRWLAWVGVVLGGLLVLIEIVLNIWIILGS